MKVVLINWDTLYRRGTTGRKGGFRPGALDLLSNLIARTHVYLYIERDDKDPRTKAWMKMKGKNIDAIRDRIIWVTKPAKEYGNDDATEFGVNEAAEAVAPVIISEEDLHFYEKSPKYASLEEVVKAIKKDLNLTSDDDVSLVLDRNNILFQPQPTPSGSRVKTVKLVTEPVYIEAEDAPLLGGKKPKSKAKRAGYGALITATVVFVLYAIAIAVTLGVIFLAPPAAPAAIAIALALDVTLKALGVGGLIASAAGAFAALTGLGAGIGALTGRKSSSKKRIELSALADITENKAINTTDAVVTGALKSRPPQRPAPSAPPGALRLPPSASDASNKPPTTKDDWTIGHQDVAENTGTHRPNLLRAGSK